MTYDDARAVIYTRAANVMQAYPSWGVFYENRLNVDLAARVDPFLTIEILFNDGEQKSMEERPIVRYLGAVWFGAANKEGQGTKQTLDVLMAIARSFQTTAVGGVTFLAPRPLPGLPKDGWYFERLRVPFYFDDTPA